MSTGSLSRLRVLAIAKTATNIHFVEERAKCVCFGTPSFIFTKVFFCFCSNENYVSVKTRSLSHRKLHVSLRPICVVEGNERAIAVAIGRVVGFDLFKK